MHTKSLATAVVIMTGMLVSAMATPTNASPRLTDSPSDRAETQWVGTGVHVTIYNASLFQCPATNCNQGVAQPADDVADICYLPLSTPWGNYWHFVLNHANHHVGFISGTFLYGSLSQTRCEA